MLLRNSKRVKGSSPRDKKGRMKCASKMKSLPKREAQKPNLVIGTVKVDKRIGLCCEAEMAGQTELSTRTASH
jgi:hypothetical protein